MNETIELRNFNVTLSEKVDSDSEGVLLVKGIVNRGESEPLPAKNGKTFIEKVERGTWEKALSRGNDIHFLAEHDNGKMLASTKNKSLTLTETDEGLLMEARIAPTSWGKDYHTLIEEGLLTNMSFGMAVLSDKWTFEDGVNKRSINDLALFEVSVVRDPAYKDTQIQARNLQSTEDIEIPSMEERDLSNMTVTQLEQEKTKIYNEYRTLNSESVEAENLLQQISNIDAQIQNLDTANNSQGDVRNMENQAVEKEIRAVEQFLRKQDGEELRTLTATGVGSGQLTVPTHLHNQVVEKLYEVAPLFAMTKNFTPVNGFLEILREQSIGGPTATAFIGEMMDASKADFTLDKVKLDQKRVGSVIELSNQLINDSGIDVVDYATKTLAKRVGLFIDRKILDGDKATQFEGLLNSVAIENITAGATNAITIDELEAVYLTLHPQYVKDAVWVVNRKVFMAIAKLKDANGQYYLVRDVAETGVTYKLFGQPVLISDAMPDVISTGVRSVLFGNFQEGYATMTKQGLSLKMIDNDTTNALRGSVTVLLDGYMDGKIYNENAFKFLKQA
ncbi:phage major capsid protein [Priestia megaterium]|uniref:phage major capsid protein n=1 Tax=Priestia megaterium TaxID=1404 RepID=UPI00196B8C2C|nr:phage major capsid protein [Priestia megaterium]QSF38448.1 phage major capsid protein [Priestia megaterium]